MKATGTLTIAITAAVASAPMARRSFGTQPLHDRRARMGASASPSNLRIAASIAASRAAGRGGGGFGSETESSLSVAI